MFLKSKKYEDDIELFKQKIDELNAKLDAKENAFQIFLNELHKELITTVAQHDKVNSQHEILGEKVTQILQEFHHVEVSTIESNEISDHALKKGNTLIEASTQMVTVSQESKDAVQSVEKLIDTMGEQSIKTSQSMNELSERSQQIEDIVKVISDISNQTNLLALNASIEAARAGEHGKGFAVVADEVRKLAESTKTSTEGIISLTKTTQEQIEKVYEETQKNMQLVEEGIKVSAATSEQIHALLEMITNVKNGVNELLEDIYQQKSTNEKVLNKFKASTQIFDETNMILQGHIEESDIVTEKLQEAVNKVKQYSF